MLSSLVWILLIVVFVVKNEKVKKFGVLIGIFTSVLILVVGAETWPYQLIAISFYWISSFLIALLIKWVIRKTRNK